MKLYTRNSTVDLRSLLTNTEKTTTKMKTTRMTTNDSSGSDDCEDGSDIKS